MAVLEQNFTLVEVADAERSLWRDWSSGHALQDTAITLADPERHSLTKLRMRIANIATRLGKEM